MDYLGDNRASLRDVHLNMTINNEEENKAWGAVLLAILDMLPNLQGLHISIKHSRQHHDGWSTPSMPSRLLCAEDDRFLPQMSMLRKHPLKTLTLVLLVDTIHRWFSTWGGPMQTRWWHVDGRLEEQFSGIKKHIFELGMRAFSRGSCRL